MRPIWIRKKYMQDSKFRRGAKNIMDEFEIKKIKELKARSEEQDERIWKLRQRLARVEKNILGYTLETDDNGKGR